MSQVTAPGYYPDLTAAEYHADPAPRPSGNTSVLAKLLTETPRQAKEAHPRLATLKDEPEKDEKKFDLGSVAHELLLGKGSGIQVIDADDWRTKAAKEAREEAIANGLQPCLASLHEKAQEMVAACREQLGENPENHDAFTNGRPEVPIFWQEQTEPGKMWMRGMLDWQMNQHDRVYDYKTFAGQKGADPEGFVKWLVNNGKDIQDPFYSRGVAAIEGIDWDAITFRFVVQETEYPYLISVIELDPLDRQWSYERSQWAIDKWAACARSGVYRGFAPRTHYVRVPSWAQLSWEDRKQADLMADRAVAPVAEAAE